MARNSSEANKLPFTDSSNKVSITFFLPLNASGLAALTFAIVAVTASSLDLSKTNSSKRGLLKPPICPRASLINSDTSSDIPLSGIIAVSSIMFLPASLAFFGSTLSLPSLPLLDITTSLFFSNCLIKSS